MKKIFYALCVSLALLAPSTAQADAVTEDFESVTVVDGDGNAVSGNYTAGAGLSNGWLVVGGGICKASDYSNFGLWSTAYSGSTSLTAQYGSSNSAVIVIPTKISGKLTFYTRKTSSSSSTKGYVDLFEMTPDGSSYKKVSTTSFKYFTLTSTTWTKYEVDLGSEPRFIGISLIRAGLDDVTYEAASTEPHEHAYATDWTSDAAGHWHACTGETGYCDTPKGDFAEHDGIVCSVCGYEVDGIKAFPWTEDFEGLTAGIPAGWDNSEGTTTNASYKWNYYKSYTEGVSLRFDSYNNTKNITNVLATPYIFVPATGQYDLKFKVKNPKGGNCDVLIAEYGSDERTTLLSGLTSLASWTDQTISLASYAGKVVKVYFRGTSNWGSGDAYIYLDDVCVKENIAHVHSYSTTWSTSYTHHWHVCQSTVGECSQLEADKEEHTLDADGVCTVCGYDQPYMVDFEDGIPANWTNTGWTVVNNPSYGNGTKMAFAGSYNTNYTLTSPHLMASEGDVLEIEALQPYTDEYLTLEFSLDDGDTWETAFSTVPETSNSLRTLQFVAPEDGFYLLRFSGKYNYIDNVCGFKLAEIPQMEVSTTCGAAREGKVYSDNFGRQIANATHSYTVSNTGSGTLVVYVASDNADFIVSTDKLTLEAGQSQNVDITFNHSETTGVKTATVKLTPNSGSAVTINASALCADPEEFYVDFEDGQIPAIWANSSWKVETRNGSKMAYSWTYETPLCTPCLSAKAGDVFSFDAFQQWDDESLKLEYTTDGGATWELVFDELPEANNSSRFFTFTAPADGNYILRFSGNYNYIDNVSGFKVVTGSTTLKAQEEGTYYATFSSESDVLFDSDVTVYTAATEGEHVVFTKVTNGYVPANTGVVLASEGTTAAYTLVAEHHSDIASDNQLRPASAEMETDGSYLFYKLAYNNYAEKTGLGFFWGADDGGAYTAKAGAYLAVPASTAVKGYLFAAADETDAISNVEMVQNRAIYNLRGQRIPQLQKGINIVNGRKVLR